MTDRPNAGGRRGRSDAMERLAALLADIETEPSTPDDDPPEAPASSGPAPAADPPSAEAGDGAEGSPPDGTSDPGSSATAPEDEVTPDGPDDQAGATDATTTVATAPRVNPKPVPRRTPGPGGDLAGATPVVRPPRAQTTDASTPIRRADSRTRPLDATPAAGPLTRGRRAEPDSPRTTDPSGRSGPTDPSGPAEGTGARRTGRSLTLASVAFATAVALLVVGIPVLGYAGSRALLRSRAGRVVEGKNEPDETGYRAIVDPTPTALVIQRNAEDVPVALTLLALGAGEKGGSVLLIPLGTQVRNPVYFIDRLSGAFDIGGTTVGVNTVEDALGIDLADTIEVNDELIARLVAPVAPLLIDNPDAVEGGDGRVFPAGALPLAAADVGPYLAGTAEEDELGRLARSEAVWQAWLSALGKLPETDRIGAGTTTGIGPFLRTLAAGRSVVETLDVAQGENPDPASEAVPALVPQPGITDQIIAATPFPVSPSPGRRKTMQVLNGARGEAVPQDLLHRLIRANGELTTLGNADSFGLERSVIRYRVPNLEDDAEKAAAALGVPATVKRMPTAEAAVEDDDLVIVLGKDVLDRADGGG